MSQILISNLSFAYEGSYETIFENVNLSLDTDWKLALVGRNGRGKTTFLQLLMGRYPYQGHIAASVDFSYFPYTVERPERPLSEVLTALRPECESWEIQRELALLDLSEDALDQPFETLSSGQQTRALLAAMFLGSQGFPLIDEPTNHLDMDARAKLAAYLRKKRGFILVSHDRAFLDETADHVLSINRMDISLTQGNYSVWEENMNRQTDFERRENRRLEADIRRLDQAARQTGTWADRVEKSKYGSENSGLKVDRGYVGAKSAKMMKRSKVTEARREKAARDKTALLKNIEEAEEVFLRPLAHPQSRLLTASKLSISYGGRPVNAPVSFELHRADRLALVGPNGSGKSSLLRLIAGEDISHTGTLTLASGLVLSVVPQQTDGLRGDLTEYAGDCGINAVLFRALLKKFGLPAALADQDMADYSEGQKKKVLLARSLCQSAHLYLWDEPLNFVDIVSREQIQRAVAGSGATMLFIEHDRAFVESVATAVVELD